MSNQAEDRNVTEAIESPLYEREAKATPLADDMDLHQESVSTGMVPSLEESSLFEPRDNNETVAVDTPFYDPNVTQAVDDDAYHFAETQAPYNLPTSSSSKKVYEHDENSALNPEQRALLEVVSRLADAETFHETETALSPEQEAALARKREEELRSVESDRGPFEIPEIREVLEDETSLNEDQKVHMEVAARLLSDNETFESRSEKYAELNQDGFTKRDLVDQPSVSEQAIDAAVLDEIDAPSADDISFPTPPPISELEAKPVESLVGRQRTAKHDMPSVARRIRRTMMKADRIVGPIVFVSLTLSLFILPGYLQKTLALNSAENSGIDQVNSHVSDELDKQVPDALNDPEVAGAAAVEHEQGSSSGGWGGGGTGGGSQGSTSGGNIGSQQGGESVIQARTLATKGYYKRAHQLYKEYLAMHPKSMVVRIELIRMLIAGKETRLARIECIEALKLNPSFEQTQEIAGLFQQVQLD